MSELEPSEAAAQLFVGIETDRGAWVQTLLAAGYQVCAINPMSVARYRERHSTSGAKSDGRRRACAGRDRPADRDHHRCVAGDSAAAEAQAGGPMHQTLVWDRQRQVLRLRSALGEFFPAALTVFDDLTGGDALELLQRAPEQARAAALSRAKIAAALRHARRRDVEAKAAAIQARLRAEQLRQPVVVEAPAPPS